MCRATADRSLSVSEWIPDKAHPRFEDGLVAEGVVVSRVARITIEDHARRSVGIDLALDSRDKVWHVKILNTIVGVVLREVRLPTQAVVQSEILLQFPGILGIKGERCLPIVLQIRVSLRESATS